MIRVIESKNMGAVAYAEYAGLSTDTKPEKFGEKIVVVDGQQDTKTVGLATGSLFMEADTGDVYAWDEEGEEWNKIAALGGSGS